MGVSNRGIFQISGKGGLNFTIMKKNRGLNSTAGWKKWAGAIRRSLPINLINGYTPPHPPSTSTHPPTHHWPALDRSWHLAASSMGLGVMSHWAGLVIILHHSCPALSSVLLSKETIWWPSRVHNSQILDTCSLLPHWQRKLACITTICHCCINSLVVKMKLSPLSSKLRYVLRYLVLSFLFVVADSACFIGFLVTLSM